MWCMVGGQYAFVCWVNELVNLHEPLWEQRNIKYIYILIMLTTFANTVLCRYLVSIIWSTKKFIIWFQIFYNWFLLFSTFVSIFLPLSLSLFLSFWSCLCFKVKCIISRTQNKQHAIFMKCWKCILKPLKEKCTHGFLCYIASH